MRKDRKRMIRFDDELDQGLVATAERQAESVSHVVRRACREYVHRHLGSVSYNVSVEGDIDPEQWADSIRNQGDVR